MNPAFSLLLKSHNMINFLLSRQSHRRRTRGAQSWQKAIATTIHCQLSSLRVTAPRCPPPVLQIPHSRPRAVELIEVPVVGAPWLKHQRRARRRKRKDIVPRGGRLVACIYEGYLIWFYSFSFSSLLKR